MDLAATFLAHASIRVAVPDDPAELEGLLRRAWETGRAPWPQVPLSADDFVRHLAQRLPQSGAGSPVAALLDPLALADLYLVCACVRGVPAAIDALEHQCLARLPASLKYLKLPATRLDEICQEVRIHLLLGTTETGPRLAAYAGRGTLLSWIRVIAVRMASKQDAPIWVVSDQAIIDMLDILPAPGPDAELELIKHRYRREFQDAVRETFDALPGDQQHLLRLHFIDRLSTTEMGVMFYKDQSTISRWIKSARQEVYEETKRRLKERLGLSSNDFTSLLAVLDSQLDMSLSQVLKKKG